MDSSLTTKTQLVLCPTSFKHPWEQSPKLKQIRWSIRSKLHRHSVKTKKKWWSTTQLKSLPVHSAAPKKTKTEENNWIKSYSWNHSCRIPETILHLGKIRFRQASRSLLWVQVLTTIQPISRVRRHLLIWKLYWILLMVVTKAETSTKAFLKRTESKLDHKMIT